MLIRTKLQVPPSRPSLVERRRLLARLDLPEECGLTLISAPAGSGKTTLATQWLADSGLRAAWLSLDCADNDPERFAQHLIAALREVLPEALPTSLAMLDSPATPPWPAITKTMTAELAAVRVKGPLVLVLDDLHTISAEPVQQLVRELVEALPPALHLVALTRHAPPWPLGRLRAQGRLRELSGPDLMFCFDEVRAFFATGDAPRLDEESLRLLHEKLEGWAAGLHLVRLSLEDSPDPGAGVRKLTGSQRMIASFLIEEVLAIQPPDVMEFLAATAPLGRFCAPLCDHVLRRDTAVPTARETISHLERENAFLIALDDDGCWFRYHRLFQELLLQQLEQRLGQGADRVPLQRAAEWFGSEGLTEEALQLWIASGDLDAAEQLLGEHLEAVLAEDLSRQVLRRWLHLFPSGSERGRLRCWSLTATSRVCAGISGGWLGSSIKPSRSSPRPAMRPPNCAPPWTLSVASSSTGKEIPRRRWPTEYALWTSSLRALAA